MYGLIGKKLIHSFSANFFNKKFAEEGIPEHYELLPIPSISLFPQLLKDNPDLRGLNVTIPYKEEVIQYLDHLSPEAEAIGAVNVIKIDHKEGRRVLTGYNSDYFGFKESVKPWITEDIKKALVLGTGGASKGVVYALKKLNVEPLYVSRSSKPGVITYDELDEKIMEDHLLIVNTTPLGMYPDIDSCPPIPYHLISPRHFCYDIVYNPLITKFMDKCADRGAIVKNGLEMLRLQAEASWEIWNNEY